MGHAPYIRRIAHVFVALSFIGSAALNLYAADNPRFPVKQLVIVTENQPDQIQQSALRIFASRFSDRWKEPVQILRESDFRAAQVASRPTLLFFAGRPDRHRLLAQSLAELRRRVPTTPDSYRLYSGPPAAGRANFGQAKIILIGGADSRGVLYGLGQMLRSLRQGSSGVDVPDLDEAPAPAIANRAMYFATHFGNYYEAAPLEEVDSYIEEMALWGYNELYVWFDMHWFPAGFWSDPKSQGLEMVRRLRHITVTARALGMRVGAIAVANETFRSQPPAALRCDRSSARGAYYGDSQVCPLKPEGWNMIVEDREKILDLLGPMDMWLYWPYDPGGCDCGPDGAAGWVDTFLKIGPDLSKVMKKQNPDATFLVSTWMFNAPERDKVYQLASENAEWFDGIVSDTNSSFHPSARADGFSDLVFPDISMFDNYSDCYGCNGANPAPERFTREAKRIVSAGKGAILYSEGFYDDLNKCVWARLLWNSDLNAQQIVDEYSSYYFGAGDRAPASKLIFALEETWGPEKLTRTSAERATAIVQMSDTLGQSISQAPWVQSRWRALSYRAQMDDVMVKIRALGEFTRESRLLFEEALYPRSLPELRTRASEFSERLTVREAMLKQLFQTHQDYLRYFHIDKFAYGFIPDRVLGQHNWTPLQKDIRASLELQSDEAMREAVIVSFRRWWWFNGITTEYFLF